MGRTMSESVGDKQVKDEADRQKGRQIKKDGSPRGPELLILRLTDEDLTLLEHTRMSREVKAQTTDRTARQFDCRHNKPINEETSFTQT